MCRYAFSGPYKLQWACFGRRKMFRQARGEADLDALKCPECKAPMHAMGLDFKPPRQADQKQWRKVEVLFEHGYKYFSCGCGGPGDRPKYLRDVPEFLRRHGAGHHGEYESRWQRRKRRQAQSLGTHGK